ncbi:hypothetical protein U1Q18_012317 [Sarracenia purpurea var. burkii]
MLPAKLFPRSAVSPALVSHRRTPVASHGACFGIDSASGKNYGVAISLRERITDPGNIWNAEFLSSRGTEANLDQASPIHAFSRSAGARDDGPGIPFGSLTGPGFTPAVLRLVTTGTGSGMTNFPGSISPVVPLRFDYLFGWAPTARSRVCARQSGDADGLRILRVVSPLYRPRSGVFERLSLGSG